MNFLETSILSLLQGLTEFLPVSSSGHLVLLQSLIDFEEDQILLFNLILHVATLLATMIFYRKDIYHLLFHAFKEISFMIPQSPVLKSNIPKSNTHALSFLQKFILTTFLTALIGLGLKQIIQDFYGNYRALSILFLFNGLLLFSSRWLTPHKQDQSDILTKTKGNMLDITFKMAIAIGVAQGLAVLPGISRSGSTIICAMYLGMKSQEGMKYSFLISIPTILGAFLLEVYDLFQAGKINLFFDNLGSYLIAFLISFSVGYFCLFLLLNILKKNKLYLFSYYLLVLSILTLMIG